MAFGDHDNFREKEAEILKNVEFANRKNPGELVMSPVEDQLGDSPFFPRGDFALRTIVEVRYNFLRWCVLEETRKNVIAPTSVIVLILGGYSRERARGN